MLLKLVYFKYNNPVQNKINTMHLENKQDEHIFLVNFPKNNSDLIM